MVFWHSQRAEQTALQMQTKLQLQKSSSKEKTTLMGYVMLLLIFVLLFIPALAQDASQNRNRIQQPSSLEIRIYPENLPPLVLDQKIRFMMRDGTYGEKFSKAT
jgi:hypothetical protein